MDTGHYNAGGLKARLRAAVQVVGASTRSSLVLCDEYILSSDLQRSMLIIVTPILIG
jgi:hypothetical protein